MDNFIDSLPDLTQTQVWILAAVLAVLLLIISRIVKKRKDKKNFFLMLLTLVLSAALFICVLVGIRGGGEGPHAIPPEPPADMEETEVSSSSEIIPLGDGEIPPSWQE